jgi:hypothetical protein
MFSSSHQQLVTLADLDFVKDLIGEMHLLILKGQPLNSTHTGIS